MPWPQRRKLLRVPFFLGLALLAGVAGATWLGLHERVLALRTYGWPLAAALAALAPTLLTWGLARYARKTAARAGLWLLFAGATAGAAWLALTLAQGGAML